MNKIFGQFGVFLGMTFLIHTGYSVSQFLSYLRYNEEEFNSLPLDMMLEGLIGVALAVWGSTATKSFKEIRAVQNTGSKSYESLVHRPNFITFNHREMNEYSKSSKVIPDGSEGDNIINKLLFLYENGLHTDTVIIVKNRTLNEQGSIESVKFYAHRLILIINSSVFETYSKRWIRYCHQNDQLEDCYGKFMIELDDDNPSIVSLLISSFYKSIKFSDVFQALEFLEIANKYDCSTAIDLAVSYLDRSLSEDNALEIFQFAKRIGHQKLMSTSKKFLFEWINLLDIFEYLEMDELIELLACDELPIDEIDIWNGLFKWAQVEVFKRYGNHNASRFRDILLPFLKYIRFENISEEDLAENVLKYGILHEDHIFQRSTKRPRIFEEWIQPIDNLGKQNYESDFYEAQSLTFKSNKDIRLISLGFEIGSAKPVQLPDYRLSYKKNTKYYVVVEIDEPIFSTGKFYWKEEFIVTRKMDQEHSINVKFNRKMYLSNGKKYRIQYSIEPEGGDLKFSTFRISSDVRILKRIKGSNISYENINISKDYPYLCQIRYTIT